MEKREQSQGASGRSTSLYLMVLTFMLRLQGKVIAGTSGSQSTQASFLISDDFRCTHFLPMWTDCSVWALIYIYISQIHMHFGSPMSILHHAWSITDPKCCSPVLIETIMACLPCRISPSCVDITTERAVDKDIVLKCECSLHLQHCWKKVTKKPMWDWAVTGDETVSYTRQRWLQKIQQALWNGDKSNKCHEAAQPSRSGQDRDDWPATRQVARSPYCWTLETFSHCNQMSVIVKPASVGHFEAGKIHRKFGITMLRYRLFAEAYPQIL